MILNGGNEVRGSSLGSLRAALSVGRQKAGEELDSG
jgi:hypothetical protein